MIFSSRIHLSGRRALPPVALGATAVLIAATPALAGTFSAGTLVHAPDNPLAGPSAACAQLVAQQVAKGSTNYPDAEVEPFVATDPTNSQHLIAAVQQDRWNDGGSNGLTVTVSNDGGASWHLAANQPAFSICTGGTL